MICALYILAYRLFYQTMMYYTSKRFARANHLAGRPPTLEPIRSTMKAVNRHGRGAGSVAVALRQD